MGHTRQERLASTWAWIVAITAFLLSAQTTRFLIETVRAMGRAGDLPETRIGAATALGLAGAVAFAAVFFGALAWKRPTPLLSWLALGIPSALYLIVGAFIPWVGAASFCANEGGLFGKITPEQYAEMAAHCRREVIPAYFIPLAIVAALVWFQSRLRAPTSPSRSPATPS